MSTGHIAGRAHYPSGAPHRGTVELVSAAPVRDTDSDLVTTYSGKTYLELDDDGGFVFEVPASDDPAYDPGGVTYALYYPESTGLPPVIGIHVPAGETVLVGESIPLDPQAPSYAQQVSVADLVEVRDRLGELEDGGTGNPTPMTYYGPADQPPDYVGWSFWVVTASATDPTPVQVRDASGREVDFADAATVPDRLAELEDRDLSRFVAAILGDVIQDPQSTTRSTLDATYAHLDPQGRLVVNGSRVDGLSTVVLDRQQYDALGQPDPQTLYIVTG